MRYVSKATMTGLVVASLTLVGSAVFGQTRDGNPIPATQKSMAAGQKTFQKFCASCHGTDAKGNGPMAPKDSHPPNLTDEEWIHGSTDNEIFAVISNGAGAKSEMKSFKSRVTAEDIWDVVNYLRSLGRS